MSKFIHYIVLICLFSLSVSAADKKNIFEASPVSNGYGFQVSGFHHIEPEFVAECLKKSGQQILEVGAAEGPTMIKVLNQVVRNRRSIYYTALEINISYHNTLEKNKKLFDEKYQGSLGAITIPAEGDIRKFIKNKENQFDIIYAGNVLHFFDPVDYLETIQAFHRALKPNGKLFLIVSSTEAPGFKKSKARLPVVLSCLLVLII